MKAISLWSGGKDSCLAFYLAKHQGYDITDLINFADASGTTSSSHGLSAEIISRQAGMTGTPFFQKAMPEKGYSGEFKALVEEWKRAKGIGGIVFGDIYLEGHKEWIDSVCRELCVTPIMPIWGKDTTGLIDQFMEMGFKAVIVSTRADKLGREWLGRDIDKGLIDELKVMGGIDPCGENGEFHTFVYDGPIFKSEVKFDKGNKRLEGNRWFLEIR